MMINKVGVALANVRQQKPLVHHITNYVTVNDCANICLAIGGSPIMADAIEEAADIVSISSSLIINMGTLNERTVASMLSAGCKANELGIPVVFDPVGAGASAFRNEVALKILETVKCSIIRGNLSEIRFLVENHSKTKGVDVAAEDLNSDATAIVQKCAKKLNCVIACTGKIDVISDGGNTVLIENGNEMLSDVTGTGCMCTTLVGAFAGANEDMLVAATAGVASMAIAGELAYERAGQIGLGSFRTAIIDAISKVDGDCLKDRGLIDETKD